MKIRNEVILDQRITQEHIDNHFKNILGKEGRHDLTLKEDIWKDSQTLEELDNEITEEETRKAIKDLAQKKAPVLMVSQYFFIQILGGNKGGFYEINS